MDLLFSNCSSHDNLFNWFEIIDAVSFFHNKDISLANILQSKMKINKLNQNH